MPETADKLYLKPIKPAPSWDVWLVSSVRRYQDYHNCSKYYAGMISTLESLNVWANNLIPKLGNLEILLRQHGCWGSSKGSLAIWRSTKTRRSFSRHKLILIIICQFFTQGNLLTRNKVKSNPCSSWVSLLKQWCQLFAVMQEFVTLEEFFIHVK